MPLSASDVTGVGEPPGVGAPDATAGISARAAGVGVAGREGGGVAGGSAPATDAKSNPRTARAASVPSSRRPRLK